MKNYKIAVLAGDGIGPEITQEAIKVLKLIEERNDVSFELMHAAFGACAYFEFGEAFPQGFFIYPRRRSYQDLPKAGKKRDRSAEFKGLISSRNTNPY